jgi:hypothetical protein
MHLIVHTTSGKDFISDITSKEEILAAAGGDEAKYDGLMESIYDMAANVKNLDSFSLVIEGVKTNFHPDNIVCIQVFE